ncbi:SDR family oxidoreductase [cf. Phormidesmis sp. LEGE 11477]|uniref:SDR family oxidoreductase n=1 Tax=cf. Phormidesmis sp. LEGE 11477 TaxID=1828680 RepID=UPI001882E0CE|nr:SDR family oxidoreductase [cf. Phormidesmis sp. LEGE 11477]MBE9063938.1 SDR family oxidoreductase [cf. Phormidesmis sp. LEGE 11477]
MAERIALITGANRGIGLEVVRQLAREGMTVLLGSRNPEKGEAVAKGLKEDGLNVVVCQLDVTQTADIEQVAAQISRHYGRLDVLINNAGILYDTWQTAAGADLSEVRFAFETNTLGPWQMVQGLLPLLKESSHGRIVNVSSGAGSLHGMSGGTPAYSVSKAALNALTIMLAENLKADGILVNAVCPGWVATDMGGDGGRPVEAGAASVVWAALLPDDGPTGGFFRDGKPVAW